MNNFGRFGGFMRMTDVVKNIIIINCLVYAAQFIFDNQGVGLTDKLAMYYPTLSTFGGWQIISHMFTHGGFFHLLFNMFTLYNFGIILEKVWGAKRFAFFYFFSGFGAMFLHFAIEAFVVYKNTGGFYLDETMLVSDALKNVAIGVVGASGAIYGCLAAFAFLFPNTPLMLMFVPFPIKAKYMVPLLIVFYDITFGIGGFDNVAHYAHIGGALFGLILAIFWNKKNKQTFY